MHRLFVGLRPPAAIRRALLATMGGIAGARWQDDDQLHITLRFIGEVDGNVAEDIALALGTVHASATIVHVRGAGRFDNRGRANALWAGVEPTDALAALHRKIDAAIVRVGLKPEGRAYHPHITVARLNAPLEIADQWVADTVALTTVPFTPTHFALFESHLGRNGARYEQVARYPFRGE